MSHKSLAKEILELVGGEQNVVGLTHCATRLRFSLKNRKNANKAEIQKLDGVLTVVESGGQLQVVIGNEVPYVFKEINQIGKFSVDTNSANDEKISITSKIFDIISGSFTPLLGAMAGSGMLKGLLAILTTYHILSADSGTYHILSAAGNALFYFLPILLAVTLSIKLGANPYVGAVIGGALLEPNFTGLLTAKSVTFLGIPVIPMNYSSTVFPIFIAIIIYSILEKFLKKIVHKDIQMFLVPMLSLMIMVPLTIMAFGPFGVYVGNGIGGLISFLSGKSGMLTGAVMGGAWAFIVMLGIHNGLTPIVVANLANGGDPLLAMVASSIFAEIGIAIGIMIRSKDAKVKTVAGSTVFPAIVGGVTEPIIYGFIVRYKRTIPYLIISGAIGGAIIGFFGLKQTALVLPSLFAIPVISQKVPYIIAIVISMILALLLTIIFGFENKKEVEDKKEVKDNKVKAGETIIKKEEIVSPLTGVIKPLADVDDPVFSSAAMGKGIAIEPTVGKAVSPVNGIVTIVFPTGHAIGITSDEGAEVLIHIGINTVQLEGKYFAPVVKQGDRVSQGDLLVNFDIEKIKEAGYPVTTPVIITNTDRYIDIIDMKKEEVQAEESLLTLVV
ncbi:PTS glucose transporter subunit IIA [Bacillus sp. ISL-75]|uniref:beta-glucoside-specific PTS transporter subunit IIABC n=1 Tax=Bacillus sp. ISL-75 TaxID=2819137 RepID=UPI001BE74AE7|nr:beta-glucoside-specific PTS transporter subunit IIABC [Bacillus sp. ISL-75]MBT2725502.1 PTS glucose transporter subunit IIA [Bacillus sp. ISL-75]